MDQPPAASDSRATAPRIIAGAVLAAVLVLMLVLALRAPTSAGGNAGIDDWPGLLAAIEAGAVESLDLGEHRVEARLHPDHPLVANADRQRIRSRHQAPPSVALTYPGGSASDALVAELRAAIAAAGDAGVEVALTGSHESGMPGWALATLAALGLGGLLTVLLLRHRRRWQRINAPGGRAGAAAGLGQQASPGRLIRRGELGVRFADVAGIDEAREEIEEVVDFLRRPQAFEAVGARIPRGLLLVGPPGTGKTLLAKAVAGEAGCNFLEVSGSDFVEMLVGVGAARVRALFEQARRFAPCILFVDEIDAIARRRSEAGGHGGSVEHEQTLNAFLVELDGFRERERIILMGATNRVDVLDPALLRPGRCDRQVHVELPDRDGRRAILEVHGRRVKLAAEVDLDRIARATPGFSGAGLANLVNEAAIHAARDARPAVLMDDLEWARDKVAFGKEQGGRFRAMSEAEKRITACHEAGHAVVQLSLTHTDEVHKVTIVPRGRMLGAVMSLPLDDRRSQTRSHLLDQICVLYGGRVAEELFCEDVTAGACNDIERATRIAHKMVFELGMSEHVGLIKYEAASFVGGEGHQVSEAAMHELDAEVKRILRREHQRARELVERHRDWIDRIVEALVVRETLTGDQVQELRQAEGLEQRAVAFEDRRVE